MLKGSLEIFSTLYHSVQFSNKTNPNLLDYRVNGAEFLKKVVEYVGKRRYLLAYQKPIRHLTAYPFPKFCATYEL